MKKVIMIAAGLLLLISCGYAEQNKNAPAAEKKEHVFKGKVEKIDLTSKTMTVNGEKVEGWMDSMTMSYVPDKEDVLKKIKVGDQITANRIFGNKRQAIDLGGDLLAILLGERGFIVLHTAGRIGIGAAAD